jgi:hypothetical protein
MIRYAFDFRDLGPQSSRLTCRLACRRTFGWNTACAISSVVISAARFFGTDFFFGMVNL